MTEIQTLFGKVTVAEEKSSATAFNVWTFINSISQTKEYVWSDHTAKSYSPWTVNKSFAAHIDTFEEAETMNSLFHVDPKMHHDYMFYSIQPKRNRYKPWLKKTETEKKQEQVIKDVAVKIGYNIQRTKQFWSLLTDKQQKQFLLQYVYVDTKNSKK